MLGPEIAAVVITEILQFADDTYIYCKYLMLPIQDRYYLFCLFSHMLQTQQTNVEQGKVW